MQNNVVEMKDTLDVIEKYVPMKVSTQFET
jgi:hypothetical protein